MNLIWSFIIDSNRIRKQLSSYPDPTDIFSVRFNNSFYSANNLFIIELLYFDNGNFISEMINRPLYYFAIYSNIMYHLIEHLKRTCKNFYNSPYKSEYIIDLLAMTFKWSEKDKNQIMFENFVFDIQNTKFNNIFKDINYPAFDQKFSLGSELPQFFRAEVNEYPEEKRIKLEIAYCSAIFLIKIFQIIPNIISNEDFESSKNNPEMYFKKIKLILCQYRNHFDKNAKIPHEIINFLFLALSLEITKIDVIENGLKYLQFVDLNPILIVSLTVYSDRYPLPQNFLQYDNNKKFDSIKDYSLKPDYYGRLILMNNNSQLSSHLNKFYTKNQIKAIHEIIAEKIISPLQNNEEKVQYIPLFLETFAILHPNIFANFLQTFQLENSLLSKLEGLKIIIFQNLNIIFDLKGNLSISNHDFPLFPEEEVNKVVGDKPDSSKYMKLLKRKEDLENLSSSRIQSQQEN